MTLCGPEFLNYLQHSGMTEGIRGSIGRGGCQVDSHLGKGSIKTKTLFLILVFEKNLFAKSWEQLERWVTHELRKGTICFPQFNCTSFLECEVLMTLTIPIDS